MKLGKLPATSPRVRPILALLAASEKAAAALPPVPDSVDRSGAVADWGMLDNDTIGDCTIAAVGHAVELWSAVAGAPRRMTDTEALIGYERFGYRQNVAATDTGANAQDVLTSWTSPGFRCGGTDDRLTGFCAIDPRRVWEVKAAIAWLGVVYVGVALPLAMQGAVAWSVPNDDASNLGPDWAPGSWGGHAIPAVGYDASGLTVISWGEPMRMSWGFWKTYVDEAYGLLSRDFASPNVPAETWPRLEADMACLRKEAA